MLGMGFAVWRTVNFLPAPLICLVEFCSCRSRRQVMHGWILLFLLQDGHEICFVGDEAFRQLSKVDAEADKLLDQVQHWQYIYYVSTVMFLHIHVQCTCTSYMYMHSMRNVVEECFSTLLVVRQCWTTKAMNGLQRKERAKLESFNAWIFLKTDSNYTPEEVIFPYTLTPFLL